jgi:putative ABC transport system permease protein
VTFAGLVVRAALRSKLRTALTILAAAVGTLAFVFLQSIVDLWYSGVASAQADRLVVRNKTSLTQPLPLSYRSRIAAIPGVSSVTLGGWFGGTISESQRDFFPSFYVDPPSYLGVYDELVLPERERAAWIADPCGAIIGRQLADRLGWQVGKRVHLTGTLFPGGWDFTVRGIYEGKTRAVDTSALVFGYRCLNERLPDAEKDQVGYYAVRIEDPSRSARLAATIDSMFANSPAETKTESERAFQLGFVAMSSAILSAVRIVALVILAIILLVVSNTLAMSVRERTTELATLRALGFRPWHVMTFVLAESALIGLVAGALGAALAPLVTHGFARIVAARMASFPKPSLEASTVVLGVVAATLVGLLAGVVPAVKAARIPVAEGLRRVA